MLPLRSWTNWTASCGRVLDVLDWEVVWSVAVQSGFWKTVAACVCWPAATEMPARPAARVQPQAESVPDQLSSDN